MNASQQPDEVDAVRLRQAQIRDDEVDFVGIGCDPGNQLQAVRHRDRSVARGLECRLEPVADERRIIRDNHGLGSGSCCGLHASEYRFGDTAALGFIADPIAISL